MAASDVRARRFSRRLAVLGVASLAVEATLVAFVLRTGAWGTYTWDKLLGEFALAAFLYGSMFGLAIFARLRPSTAFPTPPPYLDQRTVRRHSRLIPIVFAFFPAPGIVEGTTLALGVITPLEAAWQLLHSYSLLGMLAVALVDARTALRWRTASTQGS
jgi:hypothetical protein